MGSLLPGWDERAPGVPPKEMEDYNDDEDQEQQGYFARLERVRLARRSHPGGSPPGAAGLLHSATSLTPRGAGGAAAAAEHAVAAADGARRLLSRQSLPANFRFEDLDAPGSPVTPASPAASPLTPGGRPGRLDAYRTAGRARDTGRHKFTWWDKMGSSALNEKPDEEEDRSKAYVPQYDVTGQGLHYRIHVEDGADGEGAVDVAGEGDALPRDAAGHAAAVPT